VRTRAFFMRGASARQPGLDRLTAQATHPTDTEKLLRRRCEDDAVSEAISRRLNLARASDWPTTGQRTRPHPEARRQGRRYVVKGSAAVAAMILRRALHAQPVAARRTTRIQTLHRPTGQILHSFASQNHGPGDGRKSDAAEAPRLQNAKNWRGLCAGGPSESRQIYTISSGTVAKLWKIHGTEKRRVRKVSAWPGVAFDKAR
jgi:hypothetical protein